MSTQFAWLIEAPGAYYLCVLGAGSNAWFTWTLEADKALRFVNEQQADSLMSAVRALKPNLFDFEMNLCNARPVEHGFISREAA